MSVATPRITNKVYFFQRTNGEIIAIDGEREAWTLYAHPTKVFTNDLPPRLIGTSNGYHYAAAIEEAKEMAKTDIPAAQTFLRKAFLEEVEIAKKTPQAPPNFDTVDKRGQPTQIQ